MNVAEVLDVGRDAIWAKGLDTLALKIREIAEAAGVPGSRTRPWPVRSTLRWTSTT